jgi:deoxyribodipyrimidine photo-lyase
MTRLIWWLRRDLRLNDNAALHYALTHAESVVPVFIFDSTLLKAERLRGARKAWLFDGLRALESDLQRYGSRLIVREGTPAEALLALCAEIGAEGVVFNRDYSPYAAKRDAAVQKALAERGLSAHSCADLLIHEPHEVPSKSGKPYDVYSPFRRAWEALPKPEPYAISDAMRAKLRLPDELAALPSLPIPVGEQPVPQPIGLPGEAEALRRLEAFIAAPIYRYHERRDLHGEDGTSALSPYLRFGMISVRICYQAAQRARSAALDESARKGVDVWISELVWREFNYQVLARYPYSVRRNLRPAYDAVQWEDNPEHLAAWREGRTGYPVVDAAMRQLLQTGWMHNRTRMIVASFLCKDLLCDWRHGERFFMQHLLDGDVANNVGGWQWTAGTGTDAAPYFRVFNPIAQSEKFDPHGNYIRRWLPELAHLPDRFIHAPFRMSAAEQRHFGIVIGRDYPPPIVDHDVQRERALRMYAAAKQERDKG